MFGKVSYSLQGSRVGSPFFSVCKTKWKVHSSPKEVHINLPQFSRWPWVTDHDLGSCRFCKMIWGRGRWPRDLRKLGLFSCALLLEKSVSVLSLDKWKHCRDCPLHSPKIIEGMRRFHGAANSISYSMNENSVTEQGFYFAAPWTRNILTQWSEWTEWQTQTNGQTDRRDRFYTLDLWRGREWFSLRVYPPSLHLVTWNLIAPLVLTHLRVTNRCLVHLPRDWRQLNSRFWSHYLTTEISFHFETKI